MNRQISINKESISRAARWLVYSNRYLALASATIEMIEADIQRSVDRVVESAKKDWELHYSGTAGFTVFFMPEDESYGIVEVLVDPALGGEYEFEIIWEEN